MLTQHHIACAWTIWSLTHLPGALSFSQRSLLLGVHDMMQHIHVSWLNRSTQTLSSPQSFGLSHRFWDHCDGRTVLWQRPCLHCFPRLMMDNSWIFLSLFSPDWWPLLFESILTILFWHFHAEQLYHPKPLLDGCKFWKTMSSVQCPAVIKEGELQIRVGTTLVATNPFLRSRANGSLISSSFTALCRSKKAHFVHHIFTWQSRANASLIHSIHTNTFTPFTRMEATKGTTDRKWWLPAGEVTSRNSILTCGS